VRFIKKQLLFFQWERYSCRELQSLVANAWVSVCDNTCISTCVSKQRFLGFLRGTCCGHCHWWFVSLKYPYLIRGIYESCDAHRFPEVACYGCTLVVSLFHIFAIVVCRVDLFACRSIIFSESRGGFGMFGTLIGVTIETSSFGKWWDMNVLILCGS
jgi:hypothetical protein